MIPQTQNSIRIIPFEERFASDFGRLNLEWLEGFNLLEPPDLKYLENPRAAIIEKGGQILFAVDEKEEVAGTCAIVPVTPTVAELAKLAVTPAWQRYGIGRALAVAATDYARERKAEKMILLSNSNLVSAIKLYESLGFKHFPVPSDVEYVSTDIYMELLF